MLTLQQIKEAYQKIGFQPICGQTLIYEEDCKKCCPMCAMYLASGHKVTQSLINNPTKAITWADGQYTPQFVSDFIDTLDGVSTINSEGGRLALEVEKEYNI